MPSSQVLPDDTTAVATASRRAPRRRPLHRRPWLLPSRPRTAARALFGVCDQRWRQRLGQAQPLGQQRKGQLRDRLARHLPRQKRARRQAGVSAPAGRAQAPAGGVERRTARLGRAGARASGGGQLGPVAGCAPALLIHMISAGRRPVSSRLSPPPFLPSLPFCAAGGLSLRCPPDIPPQQAQPALILSSSAPAR